MRKVIPALLLCSCGGLAPPDDRFTPQGFSTDEIEILRSAGDAWCERAGCCPTFDGGGSIIVMVPDFIDSDTRVGRCWTSSDNSRSLIEILDRSDRPDWLTALRVTALHELGHHCGCHNHQPAGNVMAAQFDPTAQAITDVDLACL